MTGRLSLILGLSLAANTGGGVRLAISGTPDTATVGVAYSFVPTVINATSTPSFALTGTLPDGLSFNTSTGAMTGTPAAAGTTLGLSITVTDAVGSAVLGPFSLTSIDATSSLTAMDGSTSLTLMDGSTVLNAMV
jgi:hypothetical protein